MFGASSKNCAIYKGTTKIAFHSFVFFILAKKVQPKECFRLKKSCSKPDEICFSVDSKIMFKIKFFYRFSPKKEEKKKKEKAKNIKASFR